MRNQTILVVEERQIVDSVENMAKTRISTVKTKKEDLKKLRSELESELMLSQDYSRAKDSIKAANEMKKEAKEHMLEENSNLKELDGQIKELSGEVKGVQLELFDYLGEYTKRTGKIEITDNAGETHPIIVTHTIKI